jgi:hypothetical protein
MLYVKKKKKVVVKVDGQGGGKPFDTHEWGRCTRVYQPRNRKN